MDLPYVVENDHMDVRYRTISRIGDAIYTKTTTVEHIWMLSSKWRSMYNV